MEIEKRTENKDGGPNPTSTQKGDTRCVDKNYRIFCEKHRPLKIVKEMEERDV